MSESRRGDATALIAVRSVTLYALSLHTVASALGAWTEPGPARLFLAAAGLALALILGESAGGAASAGLEGARRLRLRVTAGAGYAGLAVLALTLAVGSGDPRLLGQEAVLFSVFQAVFLLLSDLGRTHLGPVANAFVLVVLASLRGGLAAAAGVTGGLALLGFFLAFDHAARVLQAYPAGRAELLGPTLRRASAALAPIVLGLALFFVLRPPPPYAGIRFRMGAGGPRDEDVAAAYRRLVGLAAVGSAVVFGVVRLLRRGQAERAPFEEVLPVERGAEEVLSPPPSPRRREYAGRRGRIVRAYVGVLARARSAGFVWRPSQTPREIAAALPAPAGPTAALTDLFVEARYGPEEPSEQQALAAERAAGVIVAGLGKSTGHRLR
ncbi:MAG: hypothetical protein DMF80_08025 [Acidobacteria bacterium]|nr:MAG: hypothetical protein DMF80_08025 [Acidobacteriota bacterium]PYQ24824.1 MAG: hypothetical protein DMF81_04405 [Acidobacteriota bacterium]